MAASALDAEALFQRHAPLIARFLRRMGAPAEDADDLLQEVFLIAHRRGGYTPGPARPFTWLAEIAVRVLRAHGRRRALAARRAALMLGGRPGVVVASAETSRRVKEALGALPDEDREILVRYGLDGQPCGVIAAALGIPLGTVYARLHGLRARLGAALQ